MSYNWNWGIFFQLSPDGTYTYVQLLLFGAGWTLATSLLAWAIALSVGAVVGVIRTSPVPLPRCNGHGRPRICSGRAE